MPGICLT